MTPKFLTITCTNGHVNIGKHTAFDGAVKSVLKVLIDHIRSQLVSSEKLSGSCKMELDILSSMTRRETSLSELELFRFTKFAPFEMELDTINETFEIKSSMCGLNAMSYPISTP